MYVWPNAWPYRECQRSPSQLRAAGFDHNVNTSPCYARSHFVSRRLDRGNPVHPDSQLYNQRQDAKDRAICDLLAREIADALPDAENKVWHGHPVWFLDGNPIVGYSKLKSCVRLMFWSGQSFDSRGLNATGTFRASDARYSSADEVDTTRLNEWLRESRDVQWDYKNIVKRKGELLRLK